jgi:peptidyl-prolyl cis-trans isomerase SurA
MLLSWYRFLAVLVLAAAVWLLAIPASSPQQQGIIAIVNDDVISSHDLNSRMALFLATSNAEDTPENRRRLAPEVLRTLIDDVLKRQEMRRRNITVSQSEIDRALAQVAAQVQIPPDALPSYLASRGVPISALVDQVESEIGWLKAVNRIAGDRVAISPEEIEEELTRSRGSDGGEFRVSEIFLSVDDPTEQPRAEGLARRLVADTRNGANFAALARTFSNGPSAAAGGDLGWLPRDELDGQMASVLATLQPGQVSDPIRAPGGYFILYLADRRSSNDTHVGRTTVTLQQVFIPVSTTAPTEAELGEKARVAQEIAAGAKTCAELETHSKESGAASRTLGPIDAHQLPPEVQRVILSLAAGESTPPVRVAEGFLVLMVCDRNLEDASTQQRSAVERRLRDQRLSAIARRHLRDLRRSALLDVRL